MLEGLTYNIAIAQAIGACHHIDALENKYVLDLFAALQVFQKN